MASSRLFKTEHPTRLGLTWGDAVVLVALAVLLYAGIRLAFHAPAVVRGPAISLSPAALPWYTARSLARMAAAYLLSLLFSLAYGSLAARRRRLGRLMLILLDVLQSVPILSFLPVVLLSLSAVLPQALAVELASVVLIFTSQAWNLTFAWYQSVSTVPKELCEASAIFRFNRWFEFKTLELPFAALSLIWNSMLSWAGGWFFLMAAEIFTVGNRDFRLPGLGAYLQAAASQGNWPAIAWGLATLVLVVVALDQLVWRPLLAWSDRFKLEMIESETPPASWFYEALRGARLRDWVEGHVWRPVGERVDGWLLRRFPAKIAAPGSRAPALRPAQYAAGVVLAAGLAYGAVRAGGLLLAVSPREWGSIAVGLGATLLRVVVALAVALAWTVPVGVAIGTNRRLSAWLQPLVQIAASVPATALFPVLILLLIRLPAGLDLAAVVLMLAGTQWYLLFNVIAGASAIPQDLKYTASLMRLGRWGRWRTLVLPALFPYVITGAITASGGAWNASIVAEHVVFRGQSLAVTGIGALIAKATAGGNYPLLLAATLSLILTVVVISRVVWQRLYRLAADRFRLE